ncbi:MAG TPA: tryptophan synthase subunit beta, partial [Phenylobacterium sp.]|nr:tryptophan synthase subunit beta [Phenylobacterium sp.]
IESAHALARVGDVAREVGKGGIVVLNLSGRGDKDVATVATHLGMEI